jgi:peptide/nickel transport system ATP-binding protein
MTEPLLSIRDLSVTLHRDGVANRVLDGVSLDVAPGRITALVGESGSGKSTIGLAIQGLLPLDAKPVVTGSVSLAGVEVVGARPAVLRDLRRRLVRAVPQDPLAALDPVMRLGRQMRERAAPGQDPTEWLPRVGLPDAARLLGAWPHQLSGGQRQRVLIAMAMMSGAPLLIADEPTTALDVTVQAQILALLRDLARRQGKAVLFVTHDLGVASELADEIVVLYGGRVAERGPVAGVLAEPLHPYAGALLHARFDLSADRARPLPVAAGDPPAPAAKRPGCVYAPRCAWALEACRETVPPLRPLGLPGRLVACHRAEERIAVAVAPAAPWPPVALGTEPALRLEGVSLSFGALPVLRGVDLSVRKGESVALVGISGSGKSTILRLAAGLLRADLGRTDVSGGSPQMVFQDAMSSLTPWLRVGEQLGERLRPLRLPAAEVRARIEAALALVGLPPAVARALPRELSGGQAQRVAVARAVVVPPDLLLCDEPISAMDVSLAAQTLNLLGDLRRRLGMAMLFVTHDLAAARVIADRIVVLEKGRIVEDGPAEEVVAHPASSHTRELVEAMPRVAARVPA